jgi:glutamine amidotransferase
MRRGKPLLAICVGMQILATEGEEGERQDGLGWIPGRVRRLVPSGDLCVPHMGWNAARPCREHPVLSAAGPTPTFYFVHSYVFDAVSDAHVVATCDYGGEFACMVSKDNIVATQFHPEKSQDNGFALLDGFARWTVERAPRPPVATSTLTRQSQKVRVMGEPLPKLTKKVAQ